MARGMSSATAVKNMATLLSTVLWKPEVAILCTSDTKPAEACPLGHILLPGWNSVPRGSCSKV